MSINVPLNDQLAASTEHGKVADFAATRDRFLLAWVLWNIVRALACTASLGCLSWALLLHSRHER
jgi:uncharacterized membrane protein